MRLSWSKLFNGCREQRWYQTANKSQGSDYIFHYSLSCSYKKIVIDYAIKKLPIFCSKITGPNILKKEEEETRIYIACLHLRFADGSSRLIFYGCRDTYLGTLLPFIFNKIHVVSSYLYLKIFLIQYKTIYLKTHGKISVWFNSQIDSLTWLHKTRE
jgi:hypothetical protein